MHSVGFNKVMQHKIMKDTPIQNLKIKILKSIRPTEIHR